MPRYLIVNADDFGRSPGVNRGIIKAYREGIVSSTSVMTNQPYFEEAASLLRDHPSLGAGVHLVFTAWKPVLPPEKIPSLVDEKGFFLPQEALLAQPGRVDRRELRAEFLAQIERFCQIVGREPDHLDCHHFAHLHPHFFSVYLDVAEETGLPIRWPFPAPEEVERLLATTPLKGLSSEQARKLMETDYQLLGSRPIPKPDRFIGSFFGEDALGLEHLLGILESIGEGVTELLTHPGFVDEELLASSGYARPREKELELLCHPQVKERVKERGIELVTFNILSSRRA